VLPEDIKDVAQDVMNHRIIMNYEAEADNVKSTDIIKAILGRVPISK
jgi:MoxR-like ATPase